MRPNVGDVVLYENNRGQLKKKLVGEIFIDPADKDYPQFLVDDRDLDRFHYFLSEVEIIEILSREDYPEEYL